MTDNATLPVEPPGFASLMLEDWRQFDEVHINFHPRLTVLTGANATGKSTILGILARHFNWTRSYSSAPLRVRDKSGEWVNVGRRRARKLIRDGDWAEVGHLTYGRGGSTPVNVPTGSPGQGQLQYDLYMPHQQPVSGAFLTSHRSVSGNYAPVSTIPTLFGDANQLFEQFTNELRTRWAGGWTGKSPQLALKEALIAAAVFGSDGNSAVDYNPEAAAIWSGFQKVLHAVMPPSLGFRRMRVRVPDVIIETRTGDFILDDASGGLSAIIEVSWQIFLRARTESSFTVLLAAPENHLHPRLQRDLIPSFLEAFPRVQFVLATHSPFVVTATPDSAVYALDYNKNGRVFARELDYANKAASADETLQRVLGVQSTMPKWAEQEFRRIVDRYMVGGISSDRLGQLRRELKRQGLESEFPDAVIAVTDSEGHRAE